MTKLTRRRYLHQSLAYSIRGVGIYPTAARPGSGDA